MLAVSRPVVFPTGAFGGATPACVVRLGAVTEVAEPAVPGVSVRRSLSFLLAAGSPWSSPERFTRPEFFRTAGDDLYTHARSDTHLASCNRNNRAQTPKGQQGPHEMLQHEQAHLDGNSVDGHVTSLRPAGSGNSLTTAAFPPATGWSGLLLFLSFCLKRVNSVNTNTHSTTVTLFIGPVPCWRRSCLHLSCCLCCQHPSCRVAVLVCILRRGGPP